MNLLIINGTKRQNNQSLKVSNYITKVAQTLSDVKVNMIDVKDFKLSLDGYYENNDDDKYKEIVKNTNAIVIVTPEYNRSFPGSLKSLLDSAGKKEYLNKAVLVAGVSSGVWGGTRAIVSLLPVLRELGLLISYADLMFPTVQDYFDESGNPKDEKANDRVKDALKELLWLGKTLKYGRENF